MIPIEEQVKIFAQRLAPILGAHDMKLVLRPDVVQFGDRKHGIAISYDGLDGHFTCYLQQGPYYRLEDILTREEGEEMLAELIRASGNFYHQADVIAKYIRVAWPRMSTLGSRLLVSLGVALKELEPQVGALPALHMLLEGPASDESVMRELIGEAYGETLGLQFDRSLSHLSKEIDARLLKVIEELYLVYGGPTEDEMRPQSVESHRLRDLL